MANRFALISTITFVVAIILGASLYVGVQNHGSSTTPYITSSSSLTQTHIGVQTSVVTQSTETTGGCVSSRNVTFASSSTTVTGGKSGYVASSGNSKENSSQTTDLIQNGGFEMGNLSSWQADTSGIFSVENKSVFQGHYALNDSAPNGSDSGGSLTQILSQNAPVQRNSTFTSAVFLAEPCESMAISIMFLNKSATNSSQDEFLIQYAFCTNVCGTLNLNNRSNSLAFVYSNVTVDRWINIQRNISADLNSAGGNYTNLLILFVSIGPCFEGNEPGTLYGPGLAYVDSINLYG